MKKLKGKFCVVKKGEFIPIKDGCFDDEDGAAEKVRALYASDAEMAILEARYASDSELDPDYVSNQEFDSPLPVYKSYDEYLEELTASGKEIVEHAWEGPIAFEGVFTGDKRFFRPGSIEWNADSFPVPFRWQKSSIQGHQGAVPVGRVDHLERKDDGTIYAYGVIIPSLNDEAAEYLRLLEAGVGSGVSVDGDSAVFDVKELADGTQSVEFSSMRIRSLTAVDIPAFDQAQVDLVHTDDEADNAEAQKPLKWEYNLTASGCAPVKPPIEWFEDPKLDEPTPIKINAQGEIHGHLALFDSCHIGFPGSCVSPPKNGTYKYFHTGELETDKGDLVEVGHLTFNTGHAAMTDTAKSAAAHYDHTGTVAADVRVGEDKHGIWVAGALRSHLGDEDVRAFRAAPLSGDWRRIAGRLELVGALAVNVPGFPVPRVRTLVASGETETLITFQEAEILASQDKRDELGQRVLAFKVQDKKKEFVQRLSPLDPEIEEFFNKNHGKGGLFSAGKGGSGGDAKSGEGDRLASKSGREKFMKGKEARAIRKGIKEDRKTSPDLKGVTRKNGSIKLKKLKATDISKFSTKDLKHTAGGLRVDRQNYRIVTIVGAFHANPVLIAYGAVGHKQALNAGKRVASELSSRGESLSLIDLELSDTEIDLDFGQEPVLDPNLDFADGGDAGDDDLSAEVDAIRKKLAAGGKPEKPSMEELTEAAAFLDDLLSDDEPDNEVDVPAIKKARAELEKELAFKVQDRQ